MSIPKPLSKKEKLFCYFYAVSNNPHEAFLKADIPFSWETFLRFLDNPNVEKEIIRWQEKLVAFSAVRMARIGLEKIAFGDSLPALRLLYSEDIPSGQDLENINLFCVSEIKRPKGGGCEIKFVDRLKALDLLAHFPQSSDNLQAVNFLNALQASASQITPDLGCELDG